MLTMEQLQDALRDAVTTARRAMPATFLGEEVKYSMTYESADDAWHLVASLGEKTLLTRSRTYLSDASRALADEIRREEQRSERNHQQNPENQIPFSRLHP